MTYICTVLVVLVVTVSGQSSSRRPPPPPPKNLGPSPLGIGGPMIPLSIAPLGSPVPLTVEATVQDVGEAPAEALSETPAQQKQTLPPSQTEQPYPPSSQPEQPYPPTSQPDQPYPPTQPEQPYSPTQPDQPYPPTQPEQPYPPTQPEQPYPPTQPEQPYPPTQPERTSFVPEPKRGPAPKPGYPPFNPKPKPPGCSPGCGGDEICARLGRGYCSRGRICSVCIRMDSIRFPASALQGMFGQHKSKTSEPSSKPTTVPTIPSEPKIPIVEYAARHRGINKPKGSGSTGRPKMPVLTLYRTGQDPSAMMSGKLIKMLSKEAAMKKMKPDTPVSNEIGYSTQEKHQQGQLTESQKVQHHREYNQEWGKFQLWLKMQKQKKLKGEAKKNLQQSTTKMPPISKPNLQQSTTKMPSTPNPNPSYPNAEMVGINLPASQQQNLLLKIQQMAQNQNKKATGTQASSAHDAQLQYLQMIALNHNNHPVYTPPGGAKPKPATAYAINEQHLKEFNAMIAMQQEKQASGNNTNVGQTKPGLDLPNANMEQLWLKFNQFLKQKNPSTPAPVAVPSPPIIMPSNTYIPQPQTPSDPFFGDLFGYNSAPQDNSLFGQPSVNDPFYFAPFTMFDGVGMWGLGLW